MEKIKRMANIYLAPSETFSDVKEKNDWLFPFIIVLLISLTVNFLIIPVSLPAQVQQIRNNPNLSIEQKNTSITMLQGIYPYISNAIVVLIVLVFTYFFMSGFISLIRFIFGGEKIAFKHVFSAVAYISVLNILASVFSYLIITSTGDLTASLSLSLFFPGLSGYLGRVIGGISLFGVWQTFLYGVLLIVFYKYSRVKAFSIMFSSYLIWRLLSSIIDLSALA